MATFAQKLVLAIVGWLWWSVANTGVALRNGELKRLTVFPYLLNVLTLGLSGVVHAVRLRTRRLRLEAAA